MPFMKRGVSIARAADCATSKSVRNVGECLEPLPEGGVPMFSFPKDGAAAISLGR